MDDIASQEIQKILAPYKGAKNWGEIEALAAGRANGSWISNREGIKALLRYKNDPKGLHDTAGRVLERIAATDADKLIEFGAQVAHTQEEITRNSLWGGGWQPAFAAYCYGIVFADCAAYFYAMDKMAETRALTKDAVGSTEAITSTLGMDKIDRLADKFQAMRDGGLPMPMVLAVIETMKALLSKKPEYLQKAEQEKGWPSYMYEEIYMILSPQRDEKPIKGPHSSRPHP